jgi:hypothetical protein
VGVFLDEEKMEHEVSSGPQAPSCDDLTRRLSKASPMDIDPIEWLTCLVCLSLHVMYCALCVGFCLMMLIGYMVVPFHTLSLM